MQIGVILGTLPITSILFQPVWSYLSDVLNTRKVLLVVGCVGVSVSMAGIGLSGSFWGVFLSAIAYSIFIAPIGSISTAAVLDYLEAESIPEAFSLIRVWGSVAFGVSSLVMGSLLLEHILDYFSWIVAGIYLLLAGLSLTFAKDEKGISTNDLRGLGALRTNRTLILFLVSMVFIGATLQISINYQTLFLQSLDAVDLLIGIVVSIQALLEVPMMFAVPMLLRTFSMRSIILAGAAILPVRWLLYFLIRDPFWMLPVQILNGVTSVSFDVVGVSFIDTQVPREWRATGQGLYGIIFHGIGPSLGLFMAGGVLDLLDVRSIWGLNMVLGVIGLALVFVALWRFSEPCKSSAGES